MPQAGAHTHRTRGSERKHAKEQRRRAATGDDGVWLDNGDEFELDEEGQRRSDWARARAKKDRQQAY